MGQNKALLQRGDQSMLDYCQAQLALCEVADVVISGDGGVCDIVANGGPLGGIYSVIKKRKPSALLVLPVDMPLMSAQQLMMLLQAGQRTNRAHYFNRVSLPAYIPVTAALTSFLDDAFTSPKFLESGRGPSFKSLFCAIGAHSVNLPDAQPLINTNTPEQWQQSQCLINL